MLAAAGVLMPIIAAITMLLRRWKLTPTRTWNPRRIFVGDEILMTVGVTNAAKRSTSLLEVQDKVSAEGRKVTFSLANLKPGDSTSASYRIRLNTRGVRKMGPLTVSSSDLLGLVESQQVMAPPAELVVFPRVQTLGGIGVTAGADPAITGSSNNTGGVRSDEFFALRPYEVGDDLRSVHWPSSARMGDLYVRQYETVQRGRLIVIIDTRVSSHTEETFETAMSAAASILNAAHSAGLYFSLALTDGLALQAGSSQTHLDQCLTELAKAKPASTNTHFNLVIGRAAVVVITTGSGMRDGGPSRLLGLTRSPSTTVLIDQGSPTSNSATPKTAPNNLIKSHLVFVNEINDFASAWNISFGLKNPTTPSPRAQRPQTMDEARS